MFDLSDSCDCGDGYGCSHGSYVYDIDIINDDKISVLNNGIIQYSAGFDFRCFRAGTSQRFG
jgi:hypothetical protein